MAVIDGVLHIGLEADQLQALGQAKNVAKISRADMPACIATGGTGATTVAATMIAARTTPSLPLAFTLTNCDVNANAPRGKTQQLDRARKTQNLRTISRTRTPNSATGSMRHYPRPTLSSASGTSRQRAATSSSMRSRGRVPRPLAVQRRLRMLAQATLRPTTSRAPTLP